MNKYQAKELLPIIEAFANGKQIQTIAQVTSDGKCMWVDTNEPHFETASSFRVKPERVYRPFQNAEECWQQMKKHEPFGWIRNKKTKEYELLQRVAPKNGVIDQYACAFKRWVFADGTPFGIKEE